MKLCGIIVAALFCSLASAAQAEDPVFKGGNLVIERAEIDSAFCFGGNAAPVEITSPAKAAEGAMPFKITNAANKPASYVLANLWFKAGSEAMPTENVMDKQMNYLAKSGQKVKIGPKKAITVKVPIPKKLSGHVEYRGILCPGK